jgi:acetolactate synthase I/II/III large subunit
MTSTAAATARLLADAGVDRVFGLPGGEVLVLIDELRRAGIDFVLMRHEANAGLAAAVYGKLRGQPGVVLTTLGPGAANLMLPLSNAYLDQEPLLAISAQIPDEYPAEHTHQLLPLHDVYRPITKFVAKITADTVHDVVPRALAACMERPFGASYLTLSARAALEAADHEASDAPRGVRAPAVTGGRPRERAAELRGLLATSKRPLVVVGLGVDPRNAARVRRWVEEWDLPVAVTPKVKGIVDETAANFVGVVGGMAADDLMCEALASADVLIGLGLDPVEIDRTWHAELPIRWVLEAPHVDGRLPAGATLVDHAQVLDALLEQPPPAEWTGPFAQAQLKRRERLTGTSSVTTIGRSAGSGTIWPGDIVEALARVVPPETIVTTDVGSHKYLFGQFWPSRVPETFWMSNGLSGMAYGLSAAIGASLARRATPVLAAVGDGGFSMNAQELETAERVGARFVTVVLEDGSYSLIKLSQEAKKLDRHGVDFSPIDTVKMAEACGVAGLRTTDPGELAAAARRAIDARRNLVIAVPVDYADYRRIF